MAEKEAAEAPKRMWYPGTLLGMPTILVEVAEYEGLKARVKELEAQARRQREMLEARYKVAVDV